MKSGANLKPGRPAFLSIASEYELPIKQSQRSSQENSAEIERRQTNKQENVEMENTEEEKKFEASEATEKAIVHQPEETKIG